MELGKQYSMLVVGIKENVGRWKEDYKHEISMLTDEGHSYKALHMLPNINEPDFVIGKKSTFVVKALGENGRLDLIRPTIHLNNPPGNISDLPPIAPIMSRTFNRERIIEAQSAFKIAADIAMHEGTSTTVDAIRARAKDIMLNFHELALEVEGILYNTPIDHGR